MSIQHEVHQCAHLGKAFVRQSAVVAREAAKVVSNQAEQSLRDTQPVIREILRNAAAETGKQARRLNSAAGIIATQALHSAIRKLQSGRSGVLTGQLRQLASVFQNVKSAVFRFSCKSLLLTGLIGLIVTAYGFWQGDSQQPTNSIVGLQQQHQLPLGERKGSRELMPVEETSTRQQSPTLLAAQSEFEQAAVEYEFALQQWNAEVAACQSVPTAQYSSRQMGIFSAMGVNAPIQTARQPDEYLYQLACQAEQRYRQARTHLESCMQ